MDEWVLAADRHGILRTVDLRRVGLGSSDIATMVAAHQITALHRGWYSVGPPDSPEHRHTLVARALLRSYRGTAVAAHHSALLMVGIPTYRADLTRVRLARCTPGPTRTRRTHSLGRMVPVELRLAETVQPAVAVVQHGLSGGPLSALVAADAALYRRIVTTDEISAALEWATYHPRSAAVKAYLALADGRHESPGETRLAHAAHLLGIPTIPQAEIRCPGFTARVDLLVEGENVVIEFDGQVKYARASDEPDPFGNQRTPQQVLWAEKRREDRLRELGFEVVRVTWADLDDLPALRRRIEAAIRRARARRLGSLPA